MSDAVFEALFHDPVYLAFKNQLYNYQMRRDAIRAQMLHWQSPVLEIGSGVSPILSDTEEVIYSDISFQAMRLLRQGGAGKAFVSEAETLPVCDGCIGTIVCSEVLEHTFNDGDAIKEFYRVMRSGGRLLLTVPANQYFFSYDDRAVGHYRRYDIPKLIAELGRNGFNNFHIQTIAGLTDKIGMLGATMAFKLISVFGSRSVDSPSSASILRLALPVYRILNRLYGSLARLEAQMIPKCLATIVLITATK